MKNKARRIKLRVLMIVLFMPHILLAQYTIKGTVIDIDTYSPLACAQVSIHGWYSDIDTLLTTDKDGVFILENVEEGEYIISIDKDNYRSVEEEVNIESNSLGSDFMMYSYDSESYKIEDIAKEDVFDLTIGFDLFSPALQESDDKFKSVFSFNYAYEGKFKIANRLQLGFRYTPLDIKWMAMNSDTLITKIDHGKERYFEASTSFGIFTRYIITTAGSEGHRGMFLDLGANYSFPYYFSYTYLTEGNLKITRNKIRKYNDIEAMFRLGFYWGSLNASYRFTDIMKDDFVQPPKLTLGVEFYIPATN